MDAVVCWLDTTDETYIKQRNIDFGTKQKPYDMKRIGKRDELRFCLRGLYYNMPWLRNIYLVTWGDQFPTWLDEEECGKMSPPIRRIKRETLNNGKHMYGSIAVEVCLQDIPGISDFFLYCNCDMFVCNKMKESDWVENGVGKLLTGGDLHNISKNDVKFFWYNYSLLTQSKLFKQKFGQPKFKFFKWTHQMTILSKQACKDTVEAFPELFEKTRNIKGRENTDYIGRMLFEYVSMHKGYCKENRKGPSMKYLSNTYNYTKPLSSTPTLLCTNINSNLKNYQPYIQFMLKLFPKALPSETHFSYEGKCLYRYKDVEACKDTEIVLKDKISLKGGSTRRKRDKKRKTRR